MNDRKGLYATSVEVEYKPFVISQPCRKANVFLTGFSRRMECSPEYLCPVQNIHKFLACNGLFLVQIFGQLMQLG